MAGEWFPPLMVLSVILVAGWAVFTIRRGEIEYLFLDLRLDESPMEFWIALLLLAAGAVGVLYGLLA